MALGNVATGFFRIEHATIGRSTHRAGTAAANARYITRASACEHIESVGFSRNPHAIRREVEKIEASITRKNARVVDKLQLGFDIRVSHEHRHKAVRSFLWQLTDGGRARAFACFHETGGSNPHIHIQFYDRDGNGKAVARLSASPRDRAKAGLEPNATEYVRKLWERSLNRVLEDEGYDFRVDRRNYLERGTEKPRDRWEFENGPPEPVSPAPESPHAPVAEPEPELPPVEEEDGMAYIGHEGPRESHQRVKDALEHDRELRHLNTAQERISQLKERADRLAQESASLHGAASSNGVKARQADHEAYRLDEELRPLVRQDGSLRGFHVEWGVDLPFIGKEWKSPKRRRAEYLSEEKQYQEHLRDNHAREASDARLAAEIRAREAKSAMEERTRIETDLRLTAEMFGSDATLKDAEEILRNSIRHELKQVTPQDVLADYEAGHLDGDEARRALELLSAESYISLVEQRERGEGMEM